LTAYFLGRASVLIPNISLQNRHRLTAYSEISVNISSRFIFLPGLSGYIRGRRVSIVKRNIGVLEAGLWRKV
jgi:hypothetical protein